MRPDFTQCGREWIQGNYTDWYRGPIAGPVSEADRPYLISVSTCKEFCGDGRAYYQPIDIINTVATWILPIMGLLVQAPYESNQFRRTLKAILRWLGSPISSLTCVLWNINILSKCALMVDIAVSSSVSDPESRFAYIRDSFYILSVMNQFEIRSVLPKDLVAEKLLVIALFSERLDMTRSITLNKHIAIADDQASLPILRKELASELRSRRRHGCVPVFVSLVWFLAALAFSIYVAFGGLGVRATTLNLAMGLMLGWMPVFILACIVDRNPYNTERVRDLLNDFLTSVAKAAKDKPDTIFTRPRYEESETVWLEKLQSSLRQDEDQPEDDKVFKQFFTAFSGQGRKRWHYGVSHSILADIEDTGIYSSGRGWFSIDEEVCDRIIRGPPRGPTGFHHFSLREIWQALQAVVIVEGTVGSAFALAYCTPTYGLGCRSGGFMIFMILILFSSILEIIAWMDIDGKYRGREADHVGSTITSKSKWLDQFKDRWREPTFILLDFVVTGWLLYIVWAQTVGSWETCECVGSIWGLTGREPGGYIDLLSVTPYKSRDIAHYWIGPTVASTGIMFCAMVYIITEWCTQSHLSTEDFEQAQEGLQTTRRWKHVWFYIFYRVFRCHSIMSIFGKRVFWTPVLEGDRNSQMELQPWKA